MVRPCITMPLATVLLAACSGPPTTATGPQSEPPAGPVDPPAVTYQIVLLGMTTTQLETETVLRQDLRVTTAEGLTVGAVTVDLAVTDGVLDHPAASANSGRSITVTWTIPANVTVASLLACARPPISQPCTRGPILKWTSPQ